MASLLAESSDVHSGFYASEEDIEETEDSPDARENAFVDEREAQVVWKAKTYSLAKDMKSWGRFPRQKSGADATDISKFLDILEVLGLLRKVFGTLSHSLSRLREELDCLDDGAAENLFGWTGGLQESVRRADLAFETCSVIQDTAKEWRQALQPKKGVFTKPFDTGGLAKFLDQTLMDNERLQELRFNLSAQRRAAVNRAKAAIETCDAESRASAVVLLESAMQPSCRVDFPMVTELCERLASRPLEVGPASAFLVAVIKEDDDDAGTRQLKALTIIHEMLYDVRVKTAISETEGIKAVLRKLQLERFGTSHGPTADNIRMLASEIERRCFAASQNLTQSSCSTWLPRWNSSSSKPKRKNSFVDVEWDGRSETRNLIELLRRRGHELDGTEGNIMDSVFKALSATNEELSRLHDEFDCLLDERDLEGRIALTEAMQRISVLLLAASQIQSKLLQLKQRLPGCLEAPQPQPPPPKTKDLGQFIDEAALAVDSAKREIVVLRKIRTAAVDRMKMRIEMAGAIASLQEPGKGQT